MKFWIGTSGFQYAEWKGNFYPEDLSAAKMLPFYAERLSATENATAGYGYLHVHRQDYTSADVQRWANFVREQRRIWHDVFVYFKHEEAGIGPKLALQMNEILGTL